jgi:hypothetical protein
VRQNLGKLTFTKKIMKMINEGSLSVLDFYIENYIQPVKNRSRQDAKTSEGGFFIARIWSSAKILCYFNRNCRESLLEGKCSRTFRFFEHQLDLPESSTKRTSPQMKAPHLEDDSERGDFPKACSPNMWQKTVSLQASRSILQQKGIECAFKLLGLSASGK